MKYQPTQSKPRTHLNIELFFLSIAMGVFESQFEIEFYSLSVFRFVIYPVRRLVGKPVERLGG